ncbi:DUF2809 domain-containing protein [Methyloligella halotolerans]|uniref:ribosomal maturation YjgA family protein n=1 Tax=Methyloligella halotolerans TaxID=1177755 RepID=UPI00083CC0CC|nr:DUF2809 domain-containing protein [Methyloligella halotolerans]
MVFFALAALLPSVRLVVVSVLAAIGAAGVEFSQAVHIEWFDEIRSHALGQLVFGSTFTWWDIVAYWAGIALALAGAASVHRLRPNLAGTDEPPGTFR